MVAQAHVAGRRAAGGRVETSAVLLGAAVSGVARYRSISPFAAAFQSEVEAVEAMLGSSEFERLWTEGRLLTREQAIAIAFTEIASWAETVDAAQAEAAKPGRTRAAQDEGQIETLTLRELEILRLIAEGYTNREISTRLVLALGTVKWYVTQIIGKLGVDNRTRAAARARELGFLE